MSNLTNYTKNKIIDAWKRGQALGAPATLYFGLLLCSKGDRANSTTYALNDTIAVVANDNNVHLYKCTTAGQTAASQGSLYPGLPNEAITDGTAVFTEQDSALDDGSAFVEVSIGTGAYARATLTPSLTNMAATQGGTSASSGTTGLSSNLTAITWPAPSGANWTPAGGKAWGVVVYDASSAGNALEWFPLDITKTINNGDSAPSLAAGAYNFKLS